MMGSGISIIPATIDETYRLAVLQGKVPGVTVIAGFGEQEISGSNNNVDIWGGPVDTQPEPNLSGYDLYVVSSSTADDGDPAGTGAQTVEIHYLDTAYAEQSVSATLNGTTEVNTGVNNCIFVQEHHVTNVGSGLVAAGNVDCLAGSGGSVVSRITAAGNQSMSTMRQVPAGKVLRVQGWYGAGTAATTKIANLRIRSSDDAGVLNAGVYTFKGATRVKDSGSGELILNFSVPAQATVKISAWTTGAIDVTAGWWGFLETL